MGPQACGLVVEWQRHRRIDERNSFARKTAVGSISLYQYISFTADWRCNDVRTNRHILHYQMKFIFRNIMLETPCLKCLLHTAS